MTLGRRRYPLLAPHAYTNLGPMGITRHVLILLSFLALCSGSSRADDAQRGRLPDGRAFRTDGEGNQLVDYIAELELNVESLKRQVIGLEDEVNEKQIAIERLNRGEPMRGQLEERDLVQAAPQKAALNSTREDLSSRLQAAELDLQLEKQLSAKQVVALRKDLEQARSQIDELSASNKDLSAKLEQQNSRFSELLEQSERAAKLAEVRPVAQGAPRVEEPQAPDSQNRASFSPAKSRAVQSIQSAVATELNRLGALVSTRDTLFKRYTAQPRSVSFKPASLTSSRGLNLAQIRSEVQGAQTVYALSFLRQDINQIRSRVQDDINLLQRVVK